MRAYCRRCDGPADGSRCARCARGPYWMLVVDRGDDRLAHEERVARRRMPTRRDAEQIAEVIRGLQARGQLDRRDELSLGEFLDEVWLPTQREQVRPSAWHSYHAELHRHIIPRLGHRRLVSLTARDFAGLWPHLLETGRLDGTGGLSPRTVGYLHFLVRRALADATTWTLLDTNPARRRPHLDDHDVAPRGFRAVTVWTPRQLTAFLEHVRTHRLAAVWRLAATTGLRRSELLGLCWADLDLDAGRLSVRRAYVTVDGHARMVGPATAHAPRTVGLDHPTVSTLRHWHAEQRDEHEARRDRVDRGLVATQRNGGPIDPDNFTKAFARLVRQAGLTRTSLRDLRRLHAAILLAAGSEPDVVARRLGHHDPAYTLRVCRDLVDELRITAHDQLDGLPFPLPPKLHPRPRGEEAS